jgi:MFS family permease
VSSPAASARPLPPPLYRWAVLLFVSLAMFGNYYTYDAIAPLASMLTSQLGFDDTQLGALNAIYSFPNIAMVLVGGVIVDRVGAGKATLYFTAVTLAGAALTAASGSFVVMALGRLVFGLGAESMIVAVTASLGQWFKGRQLGLAFGLNLSIARAGSYAADLSPTWAKAIYAQGWRPALLISVVLMASAFVAVLVYWRLERHAEGRFQLGRPAPSERIVWGDLVRFDRSFWYIVALCVTFYSVVLPFRSTFAIKFFQDAHHLSLEEAGRLNGYVFFAAIFVTPAFGFLADRVGRRGLFMVLGSLIFFPVFLLLASSSWNLWISTAMIGVAFSLIPAVLWPSVPTLVEPERLGTAYGLMTMLQNVGLTVLNLAVGAMNDAAHAGPGNPAGYRPMLWTFGSLSLLGVVFAVLLRQRERGPFGHGLEWAPEKAG